MCSICSTARRRVRDGLPVPSGTSTTSPKAWVSFASGNPQKVDTSVLCQTVNFDTGGRPYQLTSLNAATSGTVVNQVQMGERQ